MYMVYDVDDETWERILYHPLLQTLQKYNLQFYSMLFSIVSWMTFDIILVARRNIFASNYQWKSWQVCLITELKRKQKNPKNFLFCHWRWRYVVHHFNYIGYIIIFSVCLNKSSKKNDWWSNGITRGADNREF